MVMIPVVTIRVVMIPVAMVPVVAVAVIVPGLLAAVFLLFGAICPLVPTNKGSYCVSKCFMVFALLLLVFLFFRPTTVLTMKQGHRD